MKLAPTFWSISTCSQAAWVAGLDSSEVPSACSSRGSRNGMPAPWRTVMRKGVSFCMRCAKASGTSARNLQAVSYRQLMTSHEPHDTEHQLGCSRRCMVSRQQSS